MTPAELLKSCPHYEALKRGLVHRAEGFDPETCVGCGGEPAVGPTCICPVFGESDDES